MRNKYKHTLQYTRSIHCIVFFLPYVFVCVGAGDCCKQVKWSAICWLRFACLVWFAWFCRLKYVGMTLSFHLAFWFCSYDAFPALCTCVSWSCSWYDKNRPPHPPKGMQTRLKGSQRRPTDTQRNPKWQDEERPMRYFGFTSTHDTDVRHNRHAMSALSEPSMGLSVDIRQRLLVAFFPLPSSFTQHLFVGRGAPISCFYV